MILKKSFLAVALLAAAGLGHAATSSKVFTFSNSGDGPMTLANKRITGPGAANYSISGDTCTSSVAASGSCSMTVAFTPTAGVSYSAALEYDTNATNGAGVIPLSGAGQAVVALPSAVVAYSGNQYGPCGTMTPFNIVGLTIKTNGAPFVVNKVTSGASGWSLLSVINSTGAATSVYAPLPSTVATTGYAWAGTTVSTTSRLELRLAACGVVSPRPTTITFTTTTGATETWTGSFSAATNTWTKQ
jgi:hypothetical protein